MEDAWKLQLETLGQFIHTQRKLANLSLRELAALTDLSNAYISQIERGLHEPSLRVLRALATALGVSPETLLAHAGLSPEAEPARSPADTEAAIRADPNLSEQEKEALLVVYRTYLGQRGSA
jgi:transcriptional regulator with XRE-family HTH domain